MYFAVIISLCIVGAVFGQCPSGQVEHVCIPCPSKCHQDSVKCTKDCVPGCACPPNTVADAEGKCVEPSKCPKIQCSKINEVFFAYPKCAPQCHQTCDSYMTDGPKPIACTDQCVSDQCACPEGNLKDAVGNCLTVEQCKALKNDCAVGEYFYDDIDRTSCAPCDRDCDNYYKSDVACTLQCETNVCKCAPGFVRNRDPAEVGCIPAEECPINKDCGKNALFPWDGACAPCERTCDNFYQENIPCLAICNIGQCACKDGFVRNDKNECVSTSECPTPTCGEGEEFTGPNQCRHCDDRCPNTPVTPDKIYCTRECVSNVCRCKHGFKRDANNICVETCPTVVA